MRNAIIGFVCIVIIILSGVAIQTSGNRNVRQNELDSNLGTAMQNSMEILTINPTYSIDRGNSREFIADFIQNMLLNTTSDADFKVIVHSVDVEKGVLDVEVQEQYRQIVGTGKVNARKTTILEDYTNSNNIYYTVTFLDNSVETKTVKQVNIHGGDALSADILPQNMKIPNGKKLAGWVMTAPNGAGMIYNNTNIDQIRVTQNLEFTTSYVTE